MRPGDDPARTSFGITVGGRLAQVVRTEAARDGETPQQTARRLLAEAVSARVERRKQGAAIGN